jgi:hypothetical protein
MYRGDHNEEPYSGRISLVLLDCRFESRLKRKQWLVVCEESFFFFFSLFFELKWICECDWRWPMILILDGVTRVVSFIFPTVIFPQNYESDKANRQVGI